MTDNTRPFAKRIPVPNGFSEDSMNTPPGYLPPVAVALGSGALAAFLLTKIGVSLSNATYAGAAAAWYIYTIRAHATPSAQRIQRLQTPTNPVPYGADRYN